MPAEQKPRRPLVIYGIVLLHFYLAAHGLYFVVKASNIFRSGIDVRSGCEDARRMLRPPDSVASCIEYGPDSVKAGVLFNDLESIGFAVFFVITAIGLWLLQRWARNLVAGACLVQLAFSLRWLLFSKFAGLRTRRDPSDHSVLLQMAIELLVLLALGYGTGVPEAFGAS